MRGISRSRVARCEELNERPRPPLSVASPGRAKLSEQDGLPVGPDQLVPAVIVGWVVALALVAVALALAPSGAGAAQNGPPKLTSAQLEQLDRKVSKGGTVTHKGKRYRIKPGTVRLVRGPQARRTSRQVAKVRQVKHTPTRVRFYRPKLGQEDGYPAGAAYNGHFINTGPGCAIMLFLATATSDFYAAGGGHFWSDYYGGACPDDDRILGSTDDVSFGSWHLFFHMGWLPVFFEPWIVGPTNNSWAVEVSLSWSDQFRSHIFRGGLGGGGYELFLVEK